MTYTSPQLLTLEDFFTQYQENPRYELADGEAINSLKELSHSTNFVFNDNHESKKFSIWWLKLL